MKSKVDEEEEEEDEEGQKGKKFIEKLRTRAVFVGHRRSMQPCTPVHISFNPNNNPKNPSSSRKLAASLWEFYQFYDNHHHQTPPTPAKMHHRHGKADNNDLDFTDHQVAPYNAAVTPGRRRRRRDGEPNYNNLKTTTTELLKVLNRIWSLEEQHSANISLIKSLKSELANEQARIKELLKCRQGDRKDIDDLAKQLAEEKLSKEAKERDDDDDRLNSAVQSLENERKARKRSESLHRKLAREIEEVKSMLSDCVKEIERGNKSKKMLERLCDEFAKGIKNYEWEIRSLKQKSDKKNWEDVRQQDRMILSIAESWIDERIQNVDDDDASVLEKLEFEIEEFLKSKQKEQIQEDSDTNCFELKKPELPKPRRSPASLQVKFEDQMAWAMSKSGGIEVELESAKESNNNVVGEMRRTHHREAREIDEASCSYSRTLEKPFSRNVGSLLQGGEVKENTLKAKLSEARTKSSPIRRFKG